MADDVLDALRKIANDPDVPAHLRLGALKQLAVTDRSRQPSGSRAAAPERDDGLPGDPLLAEFPLSVDEEPLEARSRRRARRVRGPVPGGTRRGRVATATENALLAQLSGVHTRVGESPRSNLDAQHALQELAESTAPIRANLAIGPIMSTEEERAAQRAYLEDVADALDARGRKAQVQRRHGRSGWEEVVLTL